MLATGPELERIVQQYKDTVWRIALSITHNHADAEDIFQDVFVKLVESIGKIQNEEHLRAWLIKVTVNRGYSWSKSAWKRKVDSYDEKHEALGDSLEPHACDDYDQPVSQEFDPAVAQTLRGEKVMEILQKMDEPNRIAVYLFYCEGLSIREIAGMLKLKENAVKTRLSRVRSRIREEVASCA